jgi:hypothetical protein
MNRMAMVVGLLVAISSISAYGVGFIGTPTAELDQGQWNVGFNYTYISMDLDETTIKDSDGSTSKLEINDNNIQRYYGTVGYGVTDAWDAYIQLGLADVKARFKDADDPTDVEDGLNFDNDFAWGWGTKYTFHEQGDTCWGVSLQMNFLDTSSDDSGSDWEETVDYESFDLIVAVGPTVDMGGWNLYGGPFYYMIDGDLDVSGIDMGSAYKASGDLEEDSSFGGFIGAQCMVDQYCMTTEVSFSGGGWAIGAGIAMPF